MSYVAISVEGGLFPADLLDRIAGGQVEGQTPADFAIGGTSLGASRLSDEIQSAFSDARSYWDAFERRLQHSHQSSTTLTRDAWIGPLLERLGFELVRQPTATVVGGESYVISHRAGESPDAPPVQIVGVDQSLDARGERSRRGPHALVQEYLNRSDALWGIVTNGRRLRLLRDAARVSRPTYLEFDLDAIVEGNLYSEFVLFFRLLHRSRFPRDGADAAECWLEKYYQQGIEEGGRVREHLRDGVEAVLRELGSALLEHPESGALRAAFADGRLDGPKYYRQLLRLVYRLLFLMVVEERRLLFPPETPPGSDGAATSARQAVFTRYYSVGRLRDRCERYFAEDRHGDLWQGLRQTFRIFREADSAQRLGLAALDGELFGPDACPDVESAACANNRLLGAINRLSTFLDGKMRRRVNYAALDVEELGSVYEGLLEFQPRVELRATPPFDLVLGSERKQTGSYYTPPDLVRVLVDNALAPVLEERLRTAKNAEGDAKGAKSGDGDRVDGERRAREAAILGIRVCDPASGSGHFLLAAARRIARELARVRTGEAEPAPEAYREAVRDVIRECVYAVDKNPLAVDLCKVALWIEGYNAGLPLSFLDHHVKCGDSLVGVFDLDVLTEGIPDAAFDAVAGDDKKLASALKKRNKAEGAGQLSLDLAAPAPATNTLADDFAALAELDDRTASEVQAKARIYESLRSGNPRWLTYKIACDLWTAAFFLPPRTTSGGTDFLNPTTATVRRALAQPNAINGQLVGEASGLSETHPFFHWPLEFPEVFRDGGFDVVLGNPPWERIKLQEEEFFAGRDGEIARAPNKAARQKLIDQLPRGNPTLAAAFSAAKHDAESESRFIRSSGRFPLCGRGDINTYSVFAEATRSLVRSTGRAGVIVPTGIATDDTNKLFFQSIVDSAALVTLYDFENREKVFPAVDSRVKFSLLTLAGAARPAAAAEFAFFLHRVDDLRDPERRFALSRSDLALLNPNTRTCPIFRTRKDAELTKAIYRRVPVLIKEGPPEVNPWGIRLTTMFHMSNDSHLFRTREQLLGQGWRLAGNIFERDGEKYLPLYEGKMVDAYDHRAASVETVATNLKRPGQPRHLTLRDHENAECLPEPQYWVSSLEVQTRHRPSASILVYKSVTSPTNERTLIATLIPYGGVANSLIVLVFPTENSALSQIALLANLDGFVLDYVAKQKVGGVNLNFFFVKQFPFLHPGSFNQIVSWLPDQSLECWLKPRVIELTYTARDLRPLAKDLGYDGPPFRWDEERRFLIRCELDAAFFQLYGIARDDVDYIMETFPIVKRKDESAHGDYRTKRVILEIYDALQRAMDSGEAYQTRLDPPPGDRRAAHTED